MGVPVARNLSPFGFIVNFCLFVKHPSRYEVIVHDFNLHFPKVDVSCAYLPSIYLVWWTVHTFHSFFNWVVCLFIVELSAFIIYSGCKFFVIYFLPVCSLAFYSIYFCCCCFLFLFLSIFGEGGPYSLDSVLCRAKFFSVFKFFFKFVFRRSLNFWLLKISGFLPKIGVSGCSGSPAPGNICSNGRNVLWEWSDQQRAAVNVLVWGITGLGFKFWPHHDLAVWPRANHSPLWTLVSSSVRWSQWNPSPFPNPRTGPEIRLNIWKLVSLSWSRRVQTYFSAEGTFK